MSSRGTAIDRMEAYRQAGVDLGLSNAASQIAADWAQTTWQNRAGQFGEPLASDSDFSAGKRLSFDEIRERPGVYGTSEVDGTGTRPDFYERAKNFKGLGKDLVAMAVDDLPVKGAQGVFVNNALTVSRLILEDLTHIDQIFEGLAEAANEAELAIYTGEIAVHGDRIKGHTDFSVDWVGDAFGLFHETRELTGEKIAVGDELWAFAEDGFRCNGISLVRDTFTKKYGEDWHLEKYNGSTLGEAILVPSTIYSGLMTAITGGYKIEREPLAEVHGVAHITGGSIPEKVGRMLRGTGLGAVIDDPFEPPKIMQFVQAVTIVGSGIRKRQMTDEEMITTWHGGQGYIIAIKPGGGEAVAREAEARGIKAKMVGSIVAKPGLSVLSRGIYAPGKTMKF